ncbi:MAG: response regulator [Rhodospirillales bacterium]|nr:response regulator [Rhodospirillales bacterium]
MNAQTRVLVVDDEPLNREILSVMLEAAGYAVEAAPDGHTALRLLEEAPERFDAVLLDRMMPDLDGMAVIERMKAKPALREVPVIMQTALDGQDDIIAGINSGVFYYLTKPIQRAMLLSVTRQAVESRALHRRLEENLRRRASALALMTEGRFCVRTPADAADLAVALASALPGGERLVFGLSELLLNAVEHGNLGIGHEEKGELIAQNRWQEEVAARLADPDYRDKVVTVEVSRQGATTTILIRDQGVGFNWRAYVEAAKTPSFKRHGRGIALAHMSGFARIDYRGKGNEVAVSIDHPPSSDRDQPL